MKRPATTQLCMYRQKTQACTVGQCMLWRQLSEASPPPPAQILSQFAVREPEVVIEATDVGTSMPFLGVGAARAMALPLFLSTLVSIIHESTVVPKGVTLLCLPSTAIVGIYYTIYAYILAYNCAKEEPISSTGIALLGEYNCYSLLSFALYTRGIIIGSYFAATHISL